jgi:hypothetical protein
VIYICVRSNTGETILRKNHTNRENPIPGRIIDPDLLKTKPPILEKPKASVVP